MTDKEKELTEKLEAAIDAGLKLAELVRAVGPFRRDTGEAIAAIEALKPKQERLRRWANVYQSGGITTYDSESAAIMNSTGGDAYKRRAVPMIEVRPLPPMPEFEEWGMSGNKSVDIGPGRLVIVARDEAEAREFCKAHNATIAKCREWMEQVRKEIEG